MQRVIVRIRIGLSVWLVSGYARIYIGLLLSVVIVTPLARLTAHRATIYKWKDEYLYNQWWKKPLLTKSRFYSVAHKNKPLSWIIIKSY